MTNSKTTNESYTFRRDRIENTIEIYTVYTHAHAQRVDRSDQMELRCAFGVTSRSIRSNPMGSNLKWLFIEWIYDCVYRNHLLIL